MTNPRSESTIGRDRPWEFPHGSDLLMEDRLTEPSALQPWQRHPNRLFSWLEMLHFSATKFVWIGVGLRELRADALLNSMITDPEEPVFNPAAVLDEKAISKAIKWLKIIEPDLRELGLSISADTAIDLLRDLEGTSRRHNCQWLSDQSKNLEALVRKELLQRDFFYIPPERSKFFPRKNAPHVFGETVADAFPSASYDVQSAAMCMGLGLSTAAVMHLMRALEPCLLAMASRAGYAPKRDEWGKIIPEIEKHLTPGDPNYINDKTTRELLSPAATQFRHFKDAWRDCTMHARGKYTEHEAEDVFRSVKSFMMDLAKKGLKE